MTDTLQNHGDGLGELRLEEALSRLQRQELDLLAAFGGRRPDTERMAEIRHRVLVSEVLRRRNTGLNLSHLARLLGVSRSTINRWVAENREQTDD